MKKLFCVISLLFKIIDCTAQFHCGSDIANQKLLKNDTNFAAFNSKNNEVWIKRQQILSKSKIAISGKDTVYQIPVVFHIIHTGEPIGSFFNPSDAAIDSLLDFLNKSWSATWPSFPDTNTVGVRIPIQFALAKRDLFCNPITGINRVDGSLLPNYATNGVIYSTTLAGPSDSAVKSLSHFPNSDYYNIWIVKYIDGPSGYYGAYAYFSGPNLLDGTVITTKSVFSKALITHEMGHAFNLYHTFEGSSGPFTCPVNTDCYNWGDLICDTEPHYSDGICDDVKINFCTGVPYKGTQYNFMNYGSCLNRFTKNQRSRMLNTLHISRLGLMNSITHIAPDPKFVAPKAACIPSIKYPNNTKDIGPHGILFANMKTASFGYYYDGKKSYVDRTCIQDPVKLIAGNTDTLYINSGSALEKMRAWIDYNDDGIFQSTEMVLSHDGTVAYETHKSAITVPTTGVVLNKYLRMRIMSDISTAPDPSPCSDVEYGQTEDYSVFIQTAASSILPNPSTSAEIKIYPNPVGKILSIENSLPVDIKIYSVEGRLVLSRNQSNSIDLSSLQDGFYVVTLSKPQDGAIIKRHKLLKLDQ